MHGEGADRRESGGGADHADTVEKRQDPRGSVLRQRHDTDRGGADGGKHCARDEEGIYGAEMGASHRQKGVGRLL